MNGPMAPFPVSISEADTKKAMRINANRKWRASHPKYTPKIHVKVCVKCSASFVGKKRQKYCSHKCFMNGFSNHPNFIQYLESRKEHAVGRKATALKYYYRNYEKNKRKYQLSKNSPEKVYGSLKCRAIKRFGCLEMTLEEFSNWYSSQEKVCVYCGVDIKTYKELNPNKNHSRLSIDKKDSSKNYSLENICIACSTCNSVKSNILTHDEMLEVATKYIKPKLVKKEVTNGR